MVKRLMLIGTLFFGLMALVQTQASAGTVCSGSWCYGGSTFSKWNSLLFTSDWFVKNTKVWPMSWSVTVCPYDTKIFFKNPGDGTGGTESFNFLGSIGSVIGTNTVFANLVGKKLSITSNHVFGDCDTCSDGDGELWYLFLDAADDAGFSCSSDPDELAQIECIKEYLNWAASEPNIMWLAYKMELYGFHAILQAWADNDHDGIEDPAVYVEFAGCTPHGYGTKFGAEIPSGTEYICSPTYIWEISRSSPTPPAAPVIGGFSCGWEQDENGEWLTIW